MKLDESSSSDGISALITGHETQGRKSLTAIWQRSWTTVEADGSAGCGLAKMLEEMERVRCRAVAVAAGPGAVLRLLRSRSRRSSPSSSSPAATRSSTSSRKSHAHLRPRHQGGQGTGRSGRQDHQGRYHQGRGSQDQEAARGSGRRRRGQIIASGQSAERCSSPLRTPATRHSSPLWPTDAIFSRAWGMGSVTGKQSASLQHEGQGTRNG